MIIIPERNIRAHSENIGVDGHGEHNRREDGEHLHREIELVGEEGVIGRLEGFNDFFVVFEDVPEANVCPDEILEIDFETRRDEGTFFLEE